MAMTPTYGKVPYPNPLCAWRAIVQLARPTALVKRKRAYQRCTAYPCETGYRWHRIGQCHDRPLDWPRRWLTLIERERRG